MSRFNTTNKVMNKTENLAGGEAFFSTPQLQLISMLLCSFVDDKYYRSAKETLEQLQILSERIDDKKFLAKAAIYARKVFGMRSITHALAGEVVKNARGNEWVKHFLSQVVNRPDDIIEIFSYYAHQYLPTKEGKYRNIPKVLRKGLAKAFDNFDGYQLAKYRSAKKEFSLVDIVNLVHPKATPKNKEALKSLVENKLRNTDTWEAKLTKAGQNTTEEEKQLNKKQAWKDLIDNNKLGLFALLRNLRNIIEQYPEGTEEAINLLLDEEKIKKSLILPFRFMTAYQQFEESDNHLARKVLQAIAEVIDISAENTPKFDGKTLVVVDGSGSMSGRPIEIASLFASMFYKHNDADIILFSDDAKYLNFNMEDSIVTIAKNIKGKCRMGGTDFNKPFELANREYDRIIILSDMQGWVGYNSPVNAFNNYRVRTNCNPKIFSFDLAGYGTLEFPQKDIYCLSGFSEKVFDVIKLLEKDKEALVKEINKIEIYC